MLGIVACGDDTTPNSDDPHADWPEKIVLGLVPSQDVNKLVEDADGLSALISAELDWPVEAVVTDNYAALVVAMGTGQAHVGMFGPVALMQAEDQSGAQTILQSVRRGTASYHTQWFTNNPDKYCDTPVVKKANPEGHEFSYCNGTDTATTGPAGEDALKKIVKGDTISFVDETSASGYYYPATQLGKVTGLDPLNDIDAQFAGGHPNSVLNVYNGDYEVGVSFDDARANVLAEHPDVADKVIVFAWSTEIPNDGVAVAGDLPQSLKDALKAAFLAVMATDEGKQAFLDVYSIEGLVEADEAALNAAREMYQNFGQS
jgi:phosphonate transport system substrate-binding protein